MHKKKSEKRRFVFRKFYPLHSSHFICGGKIKGDFHIIVEKCLGLFSHFAFEFSHIGKHRKNRGGGRTEFLCDFSCGKCVFTAISYRFESRRYNFVFCEFEFRRHNSLLENLLLCNRCFISLPLLYYIPYGLSTAKTVLQKNALYYAVRTYSTAFCREFGRNENTVVYGRTVFVEIANKRVIMKSETE